MHRTELITTTPEIREQLSLMHADLLTLTSAVATRYYRAVHGQWLSSIINALHTDTQAGMTSSKTSLDVYEICGNVLNSFRDRQVKVAELIWSQSCNLYECYGLNS